MRLILLGLPLALGLTAPAVAKVVEYRCSGIEQTGVQSRVPGKSGGLSARKNFSLRISMANNQIVGWSAAGDRPAPIWITQAMLSSMPFAQSCRMNKDGTVARSCDFSLSASAISMMRMITTKGETAWMIERIGTQPYSARFRFIGHSNHVGPDGKTAQVSSGTCVAQ